MTKNLDLLLTSLRDTGGIERLMDYLFYQISAINGFDSYGHYLRAQLIVNTCTTYAIRNDVSCTANFEKPITRAASNGKLDESGRSPRLARQDRVAHGESVEDVLAGDETGGRKRTNASRAGSGGSKAPDALALPPALLPGGGTSSGQAQKIGSATVPSSQSSGSGSGSSDPAAQLLDYLLGGDG